MGLCGDGWGVGCVVERWEVRVMGEVCVVGVMRGCSC